MSERTMRWIGWIVSLLVIAFLLQDAATALVWPHMLDAEDAATGFPSDLVAPVGAMALIAALLYALPWTAAIGAILITGFLGGAIAIHFRIHGLATPPQLICLALGLATWAGLWLRDGRMRALLTGGGVR